MKKRKFFNPELLILTIIATIMLVLLLAIGSHFFINAKRNASAEIQPLINVVAVLFVAVIALLITIVVVFLVSRYKYIRLKDSADQKGNLTSLTVEEVSSDGIEEMVTFFDNIIDEVVADGNLPCWEKGVYPARESVENGVRRGSLFAVRHDEEIIGAFDLSTDPAGGYSLGRWQLDLKDGEFLVLHTLAVKKSYQSQGIARHMINYAKKLTADYGAKSLRADCTLLNGKAMRLFESVGFVSCGAFNLGRDVKGASRFQLYEYVLGSEQDGSTSV